MPESWNRAKPTCKTPSARWLARRISAEAKSLPGNIALIRADNAQIQGDLAETVKYAELSLQLIPEDDVYLRAQAAITLEFTHWATGNLEASLRAMYAWIEDMQRLGNQVFAIASAFAVADMQADIGSPGGSRKGSAPSHPTGRRAGTGSGTCYRPSSPGVGFAGP